MKKKTIIPILKFVPDVDAMTKKRKFLIIKFFLLASFVITLIGFGVLYWCFIDWMNPFNDAQFTIEKWANVRNDDRAPMALDLVTEHLTPGLSQSDVKALLGLPDNIITGEDPGGKVPLGDKTYKYKLGSWTYYKGFDDAFVYVHFDTNGFLIRSEINGY